MWRTRGVSQQDERSGRTYRFLVGSTKRKSINAWEKLVVRSLLHAKQKSKQIADSRLANGEIRVELSGLKLNKSGMQKIKHLEDLERQHALDDADSGLFSRFAACSATGWSVYSWPSFVSQPLR